MGIKVSHRNCCNTYGRMNKSKKEFKEQHFIWSIRWLWLLGYLFVYFIYPFCCYWKGIFNYISRWIVLVLILKINVVFALAVERRMKIFRPRKNNTVILSPSIASLPPSSLLLGLLSFICRSLLGGRD